MQAKRFIPERAYICLFPLLEDPLSVLLFFSFLFFSTRKKAA